MRLPFAPCLQRSGLPTPPRSVRQTQDIEASPHHTTTTILPPPLPPPPLPTTTATSAITAIKLGTSRCQRLEAEVTVLRVECVRPLAEPSRVPSEARVSDEGEGFLRVSSVSLASSTCSSPGSHALCLILWSSLRFCLWSRLSSPREDRSGLYWLPVNDVLVTFVRLKKKKNYYLFADDRFVFEFLWWGFYFYSRSCFLWGFFGHRLTTQTVKYQRVLSIEKKHSKPVYSEDWFFW